MDAEQELAQYREWHRKLTKDPEIRKKWQRVLKDADPNALTPDLDAEEKLNARLADEKKILQERIEKLEAEQLKAELSRKYEDQKAKLSGPPWNFDSEDMQAVEELIKAKGFDYETAAEFYKVKMEAQTPTRPSGLGLGGTTRSKSMREHRKAFNDRYKGVFKRPGTAQWQSTFDDAYEKVRSGQYLKE